MGWSVHPLITGSLFLFFLFRFFLLSCWSVQLSREYSRRLVFELQEQEKELVGQMQDQQRQALAEIRSLADLKTDAQDDLQKAYQELSMKDQRYQKLLTDLQLIQAEKDVSSPSVSFLALSRSSPLLLQPALFLSPQYASQGERARLQAQLQGATQIGICRQTEREREIGRDREIARPR